VLVSFLILSSVIFVASESRLGNGFSKIFNYQPLTSRQDIFSDSLPEHGVLGYVSEKKPSDIYYDIDASRRYYMTQNLLAPLLIDNNPNHPLVIGNYRDSWSKVNLTGYRLLEEGQPRLFLLEKQN
jgi:hypothetical protein